MSQRWIILLWLTHSRGWPCLPLYKQNLMSESLVQSPVCQFFLRSSTLTLSLPWQCSAMHCCEILLTGFLLFLLMVACDSPGCSWERKTDNCGLARHRASCHFYKRASTLANRKRQDHIKEAVVSNLALRLCTTVSSFICFEIEYSIVANVRESLPFDMWKIVLASNQFSAADFLGQYLWLASHVVPWAS